MLKFGAISWNYRTNPEDFQLRLKNSVAEWSEFAQRIGARGRVILTTCNRVEFYFTYDEDSFNEEEIRKSEASVLLSTDAIRHLFMVSAGLDSISVGENEILAQIKGAYEEARKAELTDKFISLVFRKAISVGKTVREKTSISRGKTSIPVIAAEFVEDIMEPTKSKICVVGTGQMAETFLKYLVKKEPAEIIVAGRNADRLGELSTRYGCRTAALTALREVLKKVDIVFVATSSRHFLVTPDMVSQESHPAAFVDISVPRNVDPAVSEVDGVRLVGLDEIQEISKLNAELKTGEIPKAEVIISTELRAFEAKVREFNADEILTVSHQHAESIALMEIKRLMKEISKGMDPEEATRKSASAMVTRILWNYTSAIKEAAAKGDVELISRLQSIFK